MALRKEQKKEIIENLKENIANQKAMAFVDFTGLGAQDIFELKTKLAENESLFKVCKKTLLNLAMKEKKVDVDTKNLQGQLAVVFGFKEETGMAKEIYNFSKKNKNLKILGGFFENKFENAEYLIALARLPSKQELLSRLVGSISSPISNLARVLQGNIKGLLYVLAKAKT